MKKRTFKLLLGQLAEEWYAYPRACRDFRAVATGSPIFITGTYRSGTTWFANMIAMSGVWYFHEPFNPVNGLWHEQFTYLPEVTKSYPTVDKIMKALIDGKCRKVLRQPRVDHWLMPFACLPHRPSRVLIKDPIACLMTEYLMLRHQLITIVLFRHPAGFASSVLRLGWSSIAIVRQLLQHRELIEGCLSPQRLLMETVSEEIDGAAVLHGILNTILWDLVQRCPEIIYFRFEDLCRQPLDIFYELFMRLNLPYNERIRQRHHDLCFQEKKSVYDYYAHNVRRNSLSMSDSWREQLTKAQIMKIRRIWEQFSIPLYSNSSDW